MAMHRFYVVFLSLIMTAATVLSGCSGESPQELLYGSWKSEVMGPDGKPVVVTVSKDNLVVNGKSESITFQSISLTVEILKASDRSSLLVATGISKERTNLQGDALPLDKTTKIVTGEEASQKYRFVRISEDEAKQLQNAPQSKSREESWAVFIAGLK